LSESGAARRAVKERAGVRKRNGPFCSVIEDIRFKTNVLIELRFFDAYF